MNQRFKNRGEIRVIFFLTQFFRPASVSEDRIGSPFCITENKCRVGLNSGELGGYPPNIFEGNPSKSTKFNPILCICCLC